jgi:hypothetical protein
MRDAPIFIGGMFKSGTTLLRSMLAQHSAIVSGLETYWFDLTRGDTSPDATERALARLATYFDLDPATVRGFSDGSRSAEAFLDRLMTHIASRAAKRRWAEKTPGNIAVVDRIWAFWPQAQVVHIVRDPRDVYASSIEANKWQDPRVFAEQWTSTIGEGAQRVAALAPSRDVYHVVRYEDLVEDPERTMRRVVDFLGERWEPQVASFGGQSEDFDKVLQATGKASTTLERLKQPLTGERRGIWRQVLSDAQVRALREAIVQRGHGETFDAVVAESDRR